MEHIDIASPTPAWWRGGVVAIGNFDGVHRGHQTLLHLAAKEAQQHSAPLGVVTFEPHPRTVFMPKQPVFRITPPEIKSRILAACGVDFLVSLTFDHAFAKKPAEDFVIDELIGRLAVSHVVIGYDFHFGHGRRGSPEMMRSLGERFGFVVTIVEQVTDDSGLAPYSSSAIREALRQGDMAVAAEQLGYWWSVIGTVGHGDQFGRKIGFATINVSMNNGGVPRSGIYAMRVRETEGDRRMWPGAGYVGKRPTLGEGHLVLEVHLLSFSGNLYGRKLMVEFIDFIRDDRAFATTDALRDQIGRDCCEVAKRFKALTSHDPVGAFPIGRAQIEGQL